MNTDNQEKLLISNICHIPERLIFIREMVKPEYFANPTLKKAYQLILELEEKQSLTFPAIETRFQKAGILPDRGSLYSLLTKPDIRGEADAAKAVKEGYFQRKLLFTLNTTFDQLSGNEISYTEAATEVLNESEAILTGATEEEKTRQELYFEHIAYLEDVFKNPEGVTGVPSGLQPLDDLTGGFKPSRLYILAARPGMGKTQGAVTIAVNAAKKGKTVSYFSLEMDFQQLVNWIIAEDANLTVESIEDGKFSQNELKELQKATERVHDLPIHIFDKQAVTVEDITTQVKILKARSGCDLVIIDYLQLISSEPSRGRNREQEVAEMSRRLKGLSKACQVPIIILAQLNRKCEDRPKKIPELSDLRESGAIEQDADFVGFIWRPKYYDIEEEDGMSVSDNVFLFIKKHRGRKLGAVKLNTLYPYARWTDDSQAPPQFGPIEHPSWADLKEDLPF